MADDAPARLLEAVRGRTSIEVELDPPVRERPVLPPHADAAVTATGLLIDSARGTADLPAICDAIARAGGGIRRIDVREPGFDDVFRKLTGEPLKEP